MRVCKLGLNRGLTTRSILGVGLALAWGFLPTYAAVYYVSPTGSDDDAGSDEGHPFASIQKALDLAKKPGDAVVLRGGTYSPTVTLQMRYSGTMAAPIELRAYPGEKPIIDGQYTFPASNLTWTYTGPPVTNEGVLHPTGETFHLSRGSYLQVAADHIVIDGVTLQHSNGDGIFSKGHHHLTLRKCDLHENHKAGILFEQCHDLIVEDCKVWENANIARFSRSTSKLNWPSTANFRECYNLLFQRNEVYHNWGEGIGCYQHPHDIVFQDNIIHDNYALELYLNNASNIIVRRNLIYNTGDPVYFRAGKRSAGLVIADEEGFRSGPGLSDGAGHHRTIVNNLLMGNGSNITFSVWKGNHAALSRLDNDLIAFNTCVDGSEWGIHIYPAANPAGHVKTVVENNLVVGEPGKLVSVPDDPGITLSHNAWSSPVGGKASGNGDVVGNPQLARAISGTGQLTPGYFKVLPASPVIGKAEPLSGIGDDFFQMARGSSPAIGAIETAK